jgi:hypothetical protein
MEEKLKEFSELGKPIEDTPLQRIQRLQNEKDKLQIRILDLQNDNDNLRIEIERLKRIIKRKER